VQKITKEFMDCFLKDDVSSGFLDTPPVRLEVRSSIDEIHEVRYEHEWPLARTQYTELYLGGQPRSLALEKPQQPLEVEYPAKNGKALFNFKFTEDTELSGYMKLRVWVEVRPGKAGEMSPEDMAMFIAVNKLDHNENAVHFNGSVGNRRDMVTRGYCKVSRRQLDPIESTQWHPIQIGTSEQKLKVGEIVPVDIELYPSSTFFSIGDSLQLILASNDIIPSPPYRKDVSCNHGRHVLHFGGDHDSHLLVPKIGSREEPPVSG
jgi:hypothetical protein